VGNNQLKIGVFLSYVTIGLNSIIGLIYTPIMLRYMGPSEYGLYSLGASIIAYLTILDFGFSNAVIRYTSKYKSEKKIDKLYGIYGMFIVMYLIISVVAIIIGFAVILNINKIFGDALTYVEIKKLDIIIKLMIFNLVFTFTFGLFSSIVTAYEKFVYLKGVNLIRILLNPLIMTILLLMGYKSIAMVIVMTLLNVITLLLSCWYCFFKLNIKINLSGVDNDLIKEIIVYSFWIFISMIVDKVYWSTGQFILGIYKGTESVAVYSVAMQLLNLYISFSMAISGVLLPKITEMISNNTSDKIISDLFIKTGRLQYIVMMYILSCFVIFGKIFISLWAGKEYQDAYFIAIIIFVPLFVPLIQNIGIQILQAMNKVKFRSLAYLLISFGSLFVTIPLTRNYGGIGTAIGISVALILGQIIVMNFYYMKIININIINFWSQIFKMSIFPVLLGIVSYNLVSFYNIESVKLLGVAIVIYSALYLPIIWYTSMNEYEKKLISCSILRFIKQA